MDACAAAARATADLEDTRQQEGQPVIGFGQTLLLRPGTGWLGPTPTGCINGRKN